MKFVIGRIIIWIQYSDDGVVEVRGQLTGTFLSFSRMRFLNWRIRTVRGGRTRYLYGASDQMEFVVRIGYLYAGVAGRAINCHN